MPRRHNFAAFVAKLRISKRNAKQKPKFLISFPNERTRKLVFACTSKNLGGTKVTKNRVSKQKEIDFFFCWRVNSRKKAVGSTSSDGDKIPIEKCRTYWRVIVKAKKKLSGKRHLRELLLRQERFPRLVVVEDTNLCYLALWLVNIFQKKSINIFRCRINTLPIYVWLTARG